MIRRALIIYCDNTKSGKLEGPSQDNINLIKHLTDYRGGEWYSYEILSLKNPSKMQIDTAVIDFLNVADYSFTVFSGHGYINSDEEMQYLEVADGDISIQKLISKSDRQTLIIDACRGYFKPTNEDFIKASRDYSESFTGDLVSTRLLFENSIMAAEKGISALFAASENESALDTDKGGAYLYSLLKSSQGWYEAKNRESVLDIREAHTLGTKYMNIKFLTIQNPVIIPEKRLKYFPFSVKLGLIHG